MNRNVPGGGDRGRTRAKILHQENAQREGGRLQWEMKGEPGGINLFGHFKIHLFSCMFYNLTGTEEPLKVLPKEASRIKFVFLQRLF